MKDLDLLREITFYTVNVPEKEIEYRTKLLEELEKNLYFLESNFCIRYYNMYVNKIIDGTTTDLENEISKRKLNIIKLFNELYNRMVLSYSTDVLKPQKHQFSIKKFIKDLFKKEK